MGKEIIILISYIYVLHVQPYPSFRICLSFNLWNVLHFIFFDFQRGNGLNQRGEKGTCEFFPFVQWLVEFKTRYRIACGSYHRQIDHLLQIIPSVSEGFG